MPSTSSLLTLLALSAFSYARTDLSGCTSSETIAYGGASMIYWVPGTGEICAFLDCGGGRAPPATTVPGCPAYSGTATYSPSYLTLATATSTMTSASASKEGSATMTAEATSSVAAVSSVASVTPVAPAVTSMTTSYGTAATLSPSAAANGTIAAGTASPSATPSNVVSTGGATGSFANSMMALAVVAVAAVVLA